MPLYTIAWPYQTWQIPVKVHDIKFQAYLATVTEPKYQCTPMYTTLLAMGH